MNAGERTRRELEVLKARLRVLVPAACAGLYLYHLWCVWKNAVDLPYWDEWETFTPGQLPAGLTLRWLFAQHNEHRLVTTKFLIWVLYKLDGWDIATHQILNFLVYGVIIACLVYGACRLAPETPAWVHTAFVALLLTPIAIQNHMMAYQSQVHFWLLFFLASSYLLFSPGQKTSALLAGCAASALSTFSLAAGVVSGVVTLATFAAFKILRARSSADTAARRRELAQLLLASVLVGGSIAAWSVGYRSEQAHTLASLLDPAFWRYYLNVLAFNFGVDEVSDAAGVVCLLIVVVPVFALVFGERKSLTAAHWAVLSTTLSTLAVLASIAAGRYGFGLLQAKSTRYAEFGMALVPLSALAWGFVLRRRKLSKALALGALWVLLFAAFWDNWRFTEYVFYNAHRNLGVKCVREYYVKGGEALCPDLYPAPLASRLDAARGLNVSFYRGLNLPEQGGGR
jgi:hypothetical protein